MEIGLSDFVQITIRPLVNELSICQTETGVWSSTLCSLIAAL